LAQAFNTESESSAERSTEWLQCRACCRWSGTTNGRPHTSQSKTASW